MKIGLIIYGSLDSLSGGYLYDRILVEHLHACGDQVEVISLPWRSYLRHLGDNWSAGLLADLAMLDLDVLVQDELNHPSLFRLNSRLRPVVRYPIISLVHHLRASERHPAALMPLYRRVERAYLNSVDGFIFNSQTTAEAVAQLLGREPAVQVIAKPAGDRLDPQIGPEQIRTRALQPGPLRLLFLGNLIPRKGLHTLLWAASFLPAESWQLTVIGSLQADPAYAARMQARVVRRGWEAQVEFTGPLDRDELVAHFYSHHVLAMPSEYEGFGIAYLEAMGFGLPAIASTAGGAREIITHGQDGFLVPVDAPRALAGYLANLHADRSRLVEMGLAAQQTYQAHPGWQASMRRIRAFLARLSGS